MKKKEKKNNNENEMKRRICMSDNSIKLYSYYRIGG